MDKSTKLYINAMNYYCKGNIDKAMEICEESISENISNKSSINLKGLLYYVKGDLENAQALWKMNYQINKDDVSKKYFDSSKNDEDKLKLYIEAQKLIKALHINDALNLLYKCKESDFNSISVNNSLAICLMKKGEYEKAAECIKKVLELDKKDRTALENKKLLKEYNIIEENYDYKFTGIVFAIILSLSVILLIVVGNGRYKSIIKGSKFSAVPKQISNSARKITPTPAAGKKNKGISANGKAAAPSALPKASPTPSPTPTNTVLTQSFPSDDIKNSIDAKDFDKLYGYVQTWQNQNLSVNDKMLLINAVNLLKQDGVQFYYNNGSKLAINKEYSKARDMLVKAYNYGQDSYLYPHIVYFLASSEQNLQNIEAAIKYYKEYDNRYPNGDYEETVLYELALMNKDLDISTSKEFAKKLSDSFPQSIYNNSNIKEILSR